jgi:serine protease Do
MFGRLFKEPTRLLIIVALLSAFSAGALVVSPTAVPAVQAEAVYQQGGEDITAVYQEVSQSVVHIRVVQQVEASSIFQFRGFTEPPGGDEYLRQGLGSGFVLDREGHLITNYHVVEGASKIDVTFDDGTMARAEIVGSDPESDIAVLKVEVASEVLRPVTFADSDALYVGQPVLAIGSPFGQQWTLTTGIVSALGRTISSGFSQFSIPSAIQTDAAINPGNSGGPLLDTQGRVIGVNAQIISGTQTSAGVGFAIPANLVRRVATALVEEGSYTYSWLGISGGSLTLDLIEAMDLSPDQRGVLVSEVTAGGPADRAGVHGCDATVELDGQEYRVGGDIITAVNGETTTYMDDLIRYLVEQTRPGDEITLTVLRDDAEQEITVTLSERSEAPETTE